MTRRHSLLALGLLVTAISGQAADQRLAVQELRPLLVRAIDAADGLAQGELVGEAARTIGQHFRSRAPLLIDVLTLRRLAQPGCARLRVSFRQEEVRLPGADAAMPRSLAFEVNFCRDGQPPRSPD